MEIKNIRSKVLGENYFSFTHPTGLKIYVYPQKGYHSTYAVIGTMYGSINTKFKSDGKLITVPDGIAHYLEHKMFESEDGDAFLKYSKTGASANAYTSYNSTCYLFSCTQNFRESLKILLELVGSPYFTDENVEKERGIIAQEIKMYDDAPEWAVSMNLLKAMYKNHPVNIDIAGTVESIAKIDKQKLLECYNAYYNLHNMVLAVVGDVNIDDVIDVADECLNPINAIKVENIFEHEPDEIVNKKVEKHLPVSTPLLEIGFKEKASKERVGERELALCEIILEALTSKSSDLVTKLVEERLISPSGLCAEFFEGPSYKASIFSAQSEKPELVAEIIYDEIEKIKSNGINQKAFENARRSIYGRAVSMLNSNSAIATSLVNGHFSGRKLFSYIDNIIYADNLSANELLKQKFDIDCSSISIVRA